PPYAACVRPWSVLPSSRPQHAVDAPSAAYQGIPSLHENASAGVAAGLSVLPQRPCAVPHRRSQDWLGSVGLRPISIDAGEIGLDMGGWLGDSAPSSRLRHFVRPAWGAASCTVRGTSVTFLMYTLHKRDGTYVAGHLKRACYLDAC